MTLSILIVNWNSRDYLRKCLLSLRETCGHIPYQLVVVDGGSFDGSGEMLADEFPRIAFVQCMENIGFGRSNNLGFEKITGDTLLLLNPDTEVKMGAVDALLAALADLPEAGLIGARLLNTDGSLQYSAVHPLPTPWNAAMDSDWLRQRWWKRRGRREGQAPFQVEAVSGACMMMRADTFRKLGGFDPRYFMYAEDMDLCFRIHMTGLRIYHAPQAVVTHHGGGCSRAQFSKFSEVMIREALCFYFLANHGRFYSALYKVLIFLSAVSRMTILRLQCPFVRGENRNRRRASITKWRTLLSWSLGQEGWAGEFFQSARKSAVT